MTTQSEIYIKDDANSWFLRNHVSKRNYPTDYLLSLFDKREFAEFNIAEFGIGRGANLFYLSHFANSVHGFDGSSLAVEHFLKTCEEILPPDTFSAQETNLCAPIVTDLKLDIIIYGFFAYMAADKELLQTRENTNSMLNENGYVFIYDFLAKENHVKTDIHNTALKVHKRSLEFWINHFDDYVLMDFRLLDNEHFKSYVLHETPAHIDTKCSMDENNWAFCALFRKKERV